MVVEHQLQHVFKINPTDLKRHRSWHLPWIMFAKFHLKKPQNLSRNALRTDETKVEVIGHTVQHHIWRKLNTNCQHEGGGMMI